jgi:hypothetical protein
MELTGKSPLDTGKGKGEGEGGSAARVVMDIQQHMQLLRESLMERLNAREKELIEEVNSALDVKTNVLSSEIDSLSLYAASSYSIGLRIKQFMEHPSCIDIIEQEGGLLATVREQMCQLENLPKVARASPCVDFVPSDNEAFVNLIQESIGHLDYIEKEDIDARECYIMKDGLLTDDTGTEMALTFVAADRRCICCAIGGALLECIVM